MEEASRSNYEDLLGIMNTAVEAVQDAGAYDQLTLYNGVFMFLYDQRANMAMVNVDETAVLELMDLVVERARSLTVQKDQSKKLQQEMLVNYEKYRQAIEQSYDTAERS